MVDASAHRESLREGALGQRRLVVGCEGLAPGLGGVGFSPSVSAVLGSGEIEGSSGGLDGFRRIGPGQVDARENHEEIDEQEAVAAGLGLLAGATLSLKETGQRGTTPFLIGLAPIVGALILAFLAKRIPLSDRTSGLKVRVSTFLRAIRGLTSDYRSGAALVALGSVQVLTVILGLGASIAAIGGSADVSSVIVVGSIGVLAVFLSFTPGGLGVYELAVAVGGSVVGDSLTLFLGAAILQRAIGVGVTLTVAAPCWLILRRSPAFPAQWTLKGLIIQDEAGERLP